MFFFVAVFVFFRPFLDRRESNPNAVMFYLIGRFNSINNCALSVRYTKRLRSKALVYNSFFYIDIKQSLESRGLTLL